MSARVASRSRADAALRIVSQRVPLSRDSWSASDMRGSGSTAVPAAFAQTSPHRSQAPEETDHVQSFEMALVSAVRRGAAVRRAGVRLRGQRSVRLDSGWARSAGSRPGARLRCSRAPRPSMRSSATITAARSRTRRFATSRTPASAASGCACASRTRSASSRCVSAPRRVALRRAGVHLSGRRAIAA